MTPSEDKSLIGLRSIAVGHKFHLEVAQIRFLILVLDLRATVHEQAKFL